MRSRTTTESGADAGRATKRSATQPPTGGGGGRGATIRRMPVNPFAAAYLHASQRSAATGGGDAPPTELLRAAQARVFQSDDGAVTL
jgi:hypothetical protein